MTASLIIRHQRRIAATLAITLMAWSNTASPLSLADEPLFNMNTVTVKHNLMFILDDSGSMASNYMPDYVASKLCFDSGNGDSGDYDGSGQGTIDGQTDNCALGAPPYMSAQFNGLAYNPEVRYMPGKRYDAEYDTGNGVQAKRSQDAAHTDTFQSVAVDPYTSTNTKNLVTSYDDRYWCTQSNGGSCVRNTVGYEFPNATYPYSGSGASVPAYYWTLKLEWHCKDDNWTDCLKTDVPSGAYNKPAILRWCKAAITNSNNDDADGGIKPHFPNDSTFDLTKCQRTNDGTTYVYPHFLGTVSASDSAAFATITVSSSVQSYQSIDTIQYTAPSPPATYSVTASSGTVSLTGFSLDSAAAIKIAESIRTKTVGSSGQQEFIACTGTSGNDRCTQSPFVAALATQNITASSVPGNTVYVFPATTGTALPIYGAAGNLLNPLVVTGPAHAPAVNPTGTIFMSDSGSNAPVCISQVKLGSDVVINNTSNCTTKGNTTLVAAGGTNSAAERNALATALHQATWVGSRSATANGDGSITIAGAPGTTDNGKAITITASRAAAATIKMINGGTIRQVNWGTNLLSGVAAGDATATNPTDLAANLASKINARTIDNPVLGITGTGYSAVSSGDTTTIYAPFGTTNPGTVTITQNPAIAKATATFTVGTPTNARVNSLNIAGTGCPFTGDIFSSNTTASSTVNTVATNIRAGTVTTNWALSGTGAQVIVTTPAATVAGDYNTCTLTVGLSSGTATFTPSTANFTGGTAAAFATGTTLGTSTTTAFAPIPATPSVLMGGGINEVGTIPTTVSPFAGGASGRTNVGTFTRTDIVPGHDYSKAAGRTDCAANNLCTYEEEMTNFANWYAFYNTRIKTMKTGAGLAFGALDDKLRVGYTTIHQTNSLGLADFTPTAKLTWFNRLYAANPSGGTPLREALALVGRMYAGYGTLSLSDPVQYHCQKHFALLTTDGLWNGNEGKRLNGSTSMGNQDNVTAGVNAVPLPKNDGNPGTCAYASCDTGFSSSNTLADVAYYYYKTDLRDSSNPNYTAAMCQGDGPTGNDVCQNKNDPTDDDEPSKPQHMVTYTLGLGVDGRLGFDKDYRSGTSQDFELIKNGQKKWPLVKADDATTIDDLWHAAVNGEGAYFSAKAPKDLIDGLTQALKEVSSGSGTGTAGAVSNLQPIDGDNKSFKGSYRIGFWSGNLVMQEINLSTGLANADYKWCAVNTFVADGEPACTGTLKAKIQDTDDQRHIYMRWVEASPPANKLRNFTWTNLTDDEEAWFNPNQLYQYSTMTSDQKDNATGESLVNYLRGQTGFETSANDGDHQLYRNRFNKPLGDIVGSEPTYMRQANFGYTENNYLGYKNDTVDRRAVVFVGANDGMLHAFDAGEYDAPTRTVSTGTGEELWAYIPGQVLENMHKLAATNYADHHLFTVDGTAHLSDFYCAACTTPGWRTLLVGALRAGGRGYYALDVTDPAAPKSLWEFKHSSTCHANPVGQIDDCNVGYSYGRPVVTKLSDGTWVVLVASGYNNTSPGDGKGYLYVLDAYTGEILKRIDIKTATVNSSGFAYFAGMADSPFTNNEITYAYGGDLNGNVWRIDVNAAAGSEVKLLAILKGPSPANNPQPITTPPETALYSGKRLVFVATGKYLEQGDLSTTDTQTIYGIADDYDTVVAGVPLGTLTNPRATATSTEQVLTTSGDTRSVTNNAFSFLTKRNWYIDLPISKERVFVRPQLVASSLVVSTLIPESSACSSAGYSFSMVFDYLTGGPPAGSNGVVGLKTDSPVVGQTILLLPDGTYKVVLQLNDGSQKKGPDPGAGGGTVAYRNKRTSWRELLSD